MLTLRRIVRAFHVDLFINITNMSLAVLLQAAEYIERRERGKLPGLLHGHHVIYFVGRGKDYIDFREADTMYSGVSNAVPVTGGVQPRSHGCAGRATGRQATGCVRRESK